MAYLSDLQWFIANLTWVWRKKYLIISHEFHEISRNYECIKVFIFYYLTNFHLTVNCSVNILWYKAVKRCLLYWTDVKLQIHRKIIQFISLRDKDIENLLKSQKFVVEAVCFLIAFIKGASRAGKCFVLTLFLWSYSFL